MCAIQGSNLSPPASQAGALPNELIAHLLFIVAEIIAFGEFLCILPRERKWF